MARFTMKCSVTCGIGGSGGMSRRSGFELGLYSMLDRMRNEGEGIRSLLIHASDAS
jgi:hypothetical protein